MNEKSDREFLNDLHGIPDIDKSPQYYCQSSTRVELNKSMVKFSLEEITIAKDKKVPMQKKDRNGQWVAGERSYTSLDEILKKVKKPLAKCGLFIEQGLVGDLVITRLNHESGEFIMHVFPLKSMGANAVVNDLQAAGGGLTYIKRYAIAAMLAISSDEDVDGDEATGTTKQKQVATKKADTTTQSHPPVENQAHPQEQTQRGFEEERTALIESVWNCNDEDCLKQIWKSNKKWQQDPDFIFAKDERKKQFTQARESSDKAAKQVSQSFPPSTSNVTPDESNSVSPGNQKPLF